MPVISPFYCARPMLPSQWTGRVVALITRLSEICLAECAANGGAYPGDETRGDLGEIMDGHSLSLRYSSAHVGGENGLQSSEKA
jgi:hypothetical protein